MEEILPEVGSEKIHPPEIIAYRIGRFLAMGFDQHDADLLANTRHDTHYVKRMMQHMDLNGMQIQDAIVLAISILL